MQLVNLEWKKRVWHFRITQEFEVITMCSCVRFKHENRWNQCSTCSDAGSWIERTKNINIAYLSQDQHWDLIAGVLILQNMIVSFFLSLLNSTTFAGPELNLKIYWKSKYLINQWWNRVPLKARPHVIGNNLWFYTF